MSFCATTINCYELPRALRTALFAGAFAFMAGLAYGRSPVSPMPDVDMQRGLLAGSDALLERMVIPPNRPDWLLTDCGRAEVRTGDGSSYDRMRHALCEAAGKSNVAVRN